MAHPCRVHKPFSAVIRKTQQRGGALSLNFAMELDTGPSKQDRQAVRDQVEALLKGSCQCLSRCAVRPGLLGQTLRPLLSLLNRLIAPADTVFLCPTPRICRRHLQRLRAVMCPVSCFWLEPTVEARRIVTEPPRPAVGRRAVEGMVALRGGHSQDDPGGGLPLALPPVVQVGTLALAVMVRVVGRRAQALGHPLAVGVGAAPRLLAADGCRCPPP